MSRPTRSTIATAVLVLFLIGVAVITLAMAHGDRDFWDVAVPGVLTGTGTLALAVVTYLVLRGDQADRRHREERERREQASLIHVGAPEMRSWFEVGGVHTLEYSAWRVPVVNGSRYPVSHLIVHSQVDPPDLVSDAELSLRTVRRPRLLPGDRWDVDFALRVRLEPPPVVTTLVAFIDIEGSRWKRDGEYRLTDITGIHDMMM